MKITPESSSERQPARKMESAANATITDGEHLAGLAELSWAQLAELAGLAELTRRGDLAQEVATKVQPSPRLPLLTHGRWQQQQRAPRSLARAATSAVEAGSAIPDLGQDSRQQPLP